MKAIADRLGLLWSAACAAVRHDRSTTVYSAVPC